MNARDQAIDFAVRLFRVIFKRLWLPLDERIVENLVDVLIRAAAEHMQSRLVEDELEELADDRPLFEMRPERYQTVKLPRRD